MHKRMQFNDYSYIFLKAISFLNIVFFIQIFFCKLIQWKQNRLFHVSCFFTNKTENGKTTIT